MVNSFYIFDRNVFMTIFGLLSVMFAISLAHKIHRHGLLNLLRAEPLKSVSLFLGLLASLCFTVCKIDSYGGIGIFAKRTSIFFTDLAFISFIVLMLSFANTLIIIYIKAFNKKVSFIFCAIIWSDIALYFIIVIAINVIEIVHQTPFN